MNEQIAWILFSIPSILIASTVHEYAHAYAAYKLGDYTAKMNGRMTLNPIAHIDPVGAIMMILFRFGWSKPVPVNEYNFKNPVVGTAITSFAGPFSNLLLAAIMAIPLRIIVASSPDTFGFLGTFLLIFILVNISLTVFNLLPIPPLDGSKILRAFLPESLRQYWEGFQRYGMWLLILLLLPISPLYQITSAVLIFFNDLLLGLIIG